MAKVTKEYLISAKKELDKEKYAVIALREWLGREPTEEEKRKVVEANRK